MITRKQYKTIQKLKPIIISTAIVGTLLIANTISHNIANKQLEQEAQAYKQCIQEQSDTQGYIIRSYCSKNYKYLDQYLKLEYIQKGYDLYLK